MRILKTQAITTYEYTYGMRPVRALEFRMLIDDGSYKFKREILRFANKELIRICGSNTHRWTATNLRGGGCVVLVAPWRGEDRGLKSEVWVNWEYVYEQLPSLGNKEELRNWLLAKT